MTTRQTVIDVPEKVLLAEKTDEISRFVPCEWFAWDLGMGELAAMAKTRLPNPLYLANASESVHVRKVARIDLKPLLTFLML